MRNEEWVELLPSSIIVCNDSGEVVFMNNKSKITFAGDGGENIIGKNLNDCHNEESKIKIDKIIQSKEPNIYTIEKTGKKKLIYQAPIYRDDIYLGLVELSVELPENMNHFIR
jgi:transcriptional regulator with PAS, ATPase and Fis domain